MSECKDWTSINLSVIIFLTIIHSANLSDTTDKSGIIISFLFSLIFFGIIPAASLAALLGGFMLSRIKNTKNIILILALIGIISLVKRENCDSAIEDVYIFSAYLFTLFYVAYKFISE